MDVTTEARPGLHRPQKVWLLFVALVPWVAIAATWTLRPDLYAGASKSGFLFLGLSDVIACLVAGLNAEFQLLGFRAINRSSIRERWLLFSAIVGVPAFVVVNGFSLAVVFFGPIVFQGLTLSR